MTNIIFEEKNKCKIAEVTDGSTVANFFVGVYLNSFSSDFSTINEIIGSADEEIQHNLTALSLDWFEALADEVYFDDRNADSVKLGKDIRNLKLVLNSKPLNSTNIPGERTIGYRDEKDVAQLLIDYLSHNQGQNDKFIRRALYEHKTLQQNFSRFCTRWLEYLSKRTDSKKEYVIVAMKMSTVSRELRYI